MKAHFPFEGCPWQEILEDYFFDFLAFFFPDLHDRLDWSKGYSTLPRPSLRGSGCHGPGADILLRTHPKDRGEWLLWIYLEVQRSPRGGLAERIFLESARAVEHYHRPVVSLVVLGDDSPLWRPRAFGWDLHGCRLGWHFPIVKLRDFTEQWMELELSPNPFSTLVMAHLKARETHQDPGARSRWKLRLARRLYEVDHEKPDLFDFYRVLDWQLPLPEDLENRFLVDLQDFERRHHPPPHLTSLERRGLRRGRRLGQSSLLANLLSHRFEPLPSWVQESLAGAQGDDLDKWAGRILEAQSLEEVFAP